MPAMNGGWDLARRSSLQCPREPIAQDFGPRIAANAGSTAPRTPTAEFFRERPAEQSNEWP